MSNEKEVRVHVCRAEAGDGRDVETAAIVINSPIPQHNTYADQRSYFDDEAEKIIGVFARYLPQGILERLVGRLIVRYASLRIHSAEDIDEEKERLAEKIEVLEKELRVRDAEIAQLKKG
jgi:hypothetical protein